MGRGRPRAAQGRRSTGSTRSSGSPARRASLSARPCGSWPAPRSAERRRLWRPTPSWGHVTAGAWLAETLAACRRPEALAAAHPGEALEGDPAPLPGCRRALARFPRPTRPRRLPRRRHGARQDRPGARAHPAAQPARQAKRSAESHRRARFASRQLGGGGGALRPVAQRLRRASRRSRPPTASRRRRPRSFVATDLVVTSYGATLRLGWIGKTRWRLVALDEAQAIKNPDAKQTRAVKALSADSRDRADRHADREQSARSLVDLRFPQSRPSRIVESLRRLRQASRRQGARLLRPAAQARRALHPSPAEDRPERHRRSAGQDRGQGLLRSLQEAGGALSGGGGRIRGAAQRRLARTWRGADWCWRR